MYHKMQVLLNFMIDMMCSHLFVAAHCINFFLGGKKYEKICECKIPSKSADEKFLLSMSSSSSSWESFDTLLLRTDQYFPKYV